MFFKSRPLAVTLVAMTAYWQLPLLFATGLAAGFVDSIAGGGGLITLPVLLSFGLAPKEALGTNIAMARRTARAQLKVRLKVRISIGPRVYTVRGDASGCCERR